MSGEDAGSGPADAFVASPDQTRWSFDGALTFDNAARVLEAASHLELPTSDRIDLSGLRAIDSSALAVLFALQRRARSQRRKLVFESVPPGLASLAHVYGVEALL